MRLTPSENKKLRELAAIEGCSPQVGIINIIRTLLTQQPQCGIKEIEILGESNYQLLVIGRNLNQIAKVLNYGFSKPVSLEKIEELRQLISKHTDFVSKALRASVERWSIEE